MFVRYGELVEVPRNANEQELQVLEARVESVLNHLTEEADADARA